MNKLFHRSYFKEIFRQLRTIGIVGACFLMLANAVTAITLLTAKVNGTGFSTTIPGGASLAGVMMAFVYIVGVALVFSAFGWLNKRSTSDFYHSIPVTRTQIYGSSMLAVFIWMGIGLVLYSAVHALLYLVFGAPFNYLLFGCVLLNMLIASLEVMGAAAIACAISGTRFVDLFATAVILFIPRFLLTVLAIFTSRFGHGSLVVSTISPLFDPTYNIIATPYAAFFRLFGFSDFYTVDYANVGAMIYTLVYSCILIVIGGIAFNKRKSEYAGNATTNRFFQGVIRTAIGLPLLLIMVFLFMEEGEFGPGLVILLILAFVCYSLYELISTKSAKKMLKAMPLFLICLLISAVFLFVPDLISRIEFAKKVDDSNIKGFTLVEESYGYLGDFTGYVSESESYASIMRNRIVMSDPEAAKLISKAYERTRDNVNGAYVTLKIYRKGLAGSVTRTLSFTDKDYQKLYDIWSSNEEYKKYEDMFPDGRNYILLGDFSSSETEEVFEIFKREYQSLTPEQKLNVKWNYNPNSPDITLIGCKGVDNYTERYSLTEYTPMAAKRYIEIVNGRNKELVKKDLEEALKWMEDGGEGEFYIQINEGFFAIDYDCFFDFSSWIMKYNNYSGDNTPSQTDPEIYEALKVLKNAPIADDIENGYKLLIWFDSDGFIRESHYVYITLTPEEVQFLSKVMNSYYSY